MGGKRDFFLHVLIQIVFLIIYEIFQNMCINMFCITEKKMLNVVISTYYFGVIKETTNILLYNHHL